MRSTTFPVFLPTLCLISAACSSTSQPGGESAERQTSTGPRAEFVTKVPITVATVTRDGSTRLMGQLKRHLQQAMKDGGLDRKTKELTALGMAVMARCNTSTVYHLHNAMEAGATRAEIAEIIGVAMTMAGEAVALHGVQALKALGDEESVGPVEAFMETP